MNYCKYSMHLAALRYIFFSSKQVSVAGLKGYQIIYDTV